jgi:hypothetical protein
MYFWRRRPWREQAVCYCYLGITNAVVEGINSKIMAIKLRSVAIKTVRTFQNSYLLLLWSTKSLPAIISDDSEIMGTHGIVVAMEMPLC